MPFQPAWPSIASSLSALAISAARQWPRACSVALPKRRACSIASRSTLPGLAIGTSVKRQTRAHKPRHARTKDVPDPFFGGRAGFDHALDLIEQGARGLISDLLDDKATSVKKGA